MSSVSRSGWDRFLAILDPDRGRAAEQYELLHRKLVRFFEVRGTPSPPDAADLTIDRVARKIEAGEQIQDIGSYCYGVARLILLECGRQASRFESLDEKVHTPAQTAAPRHDVMRECFDGCLRQLPSETRHLIIEYYSEDKTAKIEARRKLANELGLPLGGLRLRAHRIRSRLETCIDGCIKQQLG